MATATFPNPCGSTGFLSDKLADGRWFRIQAQKRAKGERGGLPVSLRWIVGTGLCRRALKALVMGHGVQFIP